MEFLPEGTTANKHLYKEIHRCLCFSFHHKDPELWRRKNWLFLNDNAPAHHSVLAQEELAKQQVTVLPHPLYSPDLTPCDISFFPCLKEKLHGHRFQSAEEIITAARESLMQMSFSSVSISCTNVGRLA
jgi:hypothetical protein